MKEKTANIITRNKNISRIVLVTALILMVPLVSMRFTDEVNWDLFDFVVIGTLLLATSLIYELATKVVSNPKHRAVIGITLVAVLLIIWAELAVGILGKPFAGS